MTGAFAIQRPAGAIAILLRAVKSAVCAGNNRVGVIVKQSLTLVSICFMC